MQYLYTVGGQCGTIGGSTVLHWCTGVGQGHACCTICRHCLLRGGLHCCCGNRLHHWLGCCWGGRGGRLWFEGCDELCCGAGCWCLFSVGVAVVPDVGVGILVLVYTRAGHQPGHDGYGGDTPSAPIIQIMCTRHAYTQATFHTITYHWGQGGEGELFHSSSSAHRCSTQQGVWSLLGSMMLHVGCDGGTDGLWGEGEGDVGG